MSDTTSPSPAHALIDALRRQRDRLDRLHGLAERQTGLIESRQSGLLIELLSQRQQLIDQVQHGHDLVSELADRLPMPVAQLPIEQRCEVETLADAINQRLVDVLARDEQAEQRLRLLRDNARDELSSLGVARQASRAYRSPSTPGSRFADRRG